MSWRQWLHGLLAAIISSLELLATLGVAGFALGYDIHDWDYWAPTVAAVGTNAVKSVGLYIKQFPPPGTLVPQDSPKF